MPGGRAECWGAIVWKIEEIGRTYKEWEEMWSEGESYVANDWGKDEEIKWFTEISMRDYFCLSLCVLPLRNI